MKRAEQGALGASNIQRQREGTSPPPDHLPSLLRARSLAVIIQNSEQLLRRSNFDNTPGSALCIVSLSPRE